MFSIVEWIIFGFIGSNMALALGCVLQRSVNRLSQTVRK